MEYAAYYSPNLYSWLSFITAKLKSRERSGSVEKCLTREQGAASLNLTCVNALSLSKNFNASLVLVQPLYSWKIVDGT